MPYPTFNSALWAASREEGERGDLARLILAGHRARVLSDFDRLREHVGTHHDADVLAALDTWHADYQPATQ